MSIRPHFIDFGSFPSGKPEKTEDELEALRREAARQYEEQSGMRNKKRGVLKKIFGIGKESGIDIAREKASRINRLVDLRNRLEGADTSAQEVISSNEFIADEAIIKAEESLRLGNPNITEAIQGGDIALARAIFSGLSEGMKDAEKATLQNGLEKMIESQVEEMSKAGNIPGLNMLLQNNELEEIGIENLSSLPKDLVQEPEFQNELKEYLVSRLHGDVHGAGEFVEAADTCVDIKLLTRESLMNLLAREDVSKMIASSEYQAKIRNELADKFHGDVYDAKKFVEAAGKYVQMNLLTPQAVAEIISSEDFQDKIQNDLADLFSHRDDAGNSEAIKIADEYVRLGFMTKEMSAKVIADLRSEFGLA